MTPLPPPAASSQAIPLPVDVNTCPSDPCALSIVRLSKFKVPVTSAPVFVVSNFLTPPV